MDNKPNKQHFPLLTPLDPLAEAPGVPGHLRFLNPVAEQSLATIHKLHERAPAPNLPHKDLQIVIATLQILRPGQQIQRNSLRRQSIGLGIDRLRAAEHL